MTVTEDTVAVETETEVVEVDTNQFLGFLQGIPAERDLMTWINWLARPRKKVSLVGFTSSREKAPWQEADGEIWICNNLWKFVPPTWHRLYDLHDTNDIRQDKEHDAFLRSATKPVYVWEPQPDWPTSVKFPRDDVTAAFGRYLTNSISWMTAHALLEGVTDLGIYGVDMAVGTEYANQRPSCEYFLGLAAGRGVNITIPASSDLLKNITLYGAEDDAPFRSKLIERERELVTRIQQTQETHNQSLALLNQLQGALEQTRYIKTVWLNPNANRDGSAKMEDGQVPADQVPVP